jgi:hypothetical protein
MERKRVPVPITRTISSGHIEKYKVAIKNYRINLRLEEFRFFLKHFKLNIAYIYSALFTILINRRGTNSQLNSIKKNQSIR